MTQSSTTRISDEDARSLAEKLVAFGSRLTEGERSLYWAALHGTIAPEADEVNGYIIVRCESMSAPELYSTLLTPAVSANSSESQL